MFTIYSANPPLIIKLMFWPEKKEASYLHWLRIHPPKSLRSFWHALLTRGKPTVNVRLLVESRGTPGALGYQAGRDTRLWLWGRAGCGATPQHSPRGFSTNFSPVLEPLLPVSHTAGAQTYETRSRSPWKFSLRDGGTALSSAINHKIKKP